MATSKIQKPLAHGMYNVDIQSDYVSANTSNTYTLGTGGDASALIVFSAYSAGSKGIVSIFIYSGVVTYTELPSNISMSINASGKFVITNNHTTGITYCILTFRGSLTKDQS